MKNPYIIPAAMISAAMLAGFWMLKPAPQPPDISIHEAAGDGNIQALKQHLAAGTDVNVRDDGLTPLHDAASGGQKETAKLLIAEGADVDAKDKNRWTPLHNAASLGHNRVAELLIGEGADMNAKVDGTRWTPLHYAAWLGHKEVAGVLGFLGADVNAKDVNGHTPLDWAIEEKHTETAEILRKHYGGKTRRELN